jgi:hypothetical protein
MAQMIITGAGASRALFGPPPSRGLDRLRPRAHGMVRLAVVFLALTLIPILAGIAVRSSRPAAPSGTRIAASDRGVPKASGWASVPLPAREAIARTLGAHDRRYWATPVRSGFRLAAPGGDLSVVSRRSGVTVGSSRGRADIALRAIGFGGALRALRPGSLTAMHNRVSYRYAGGVRGWYANGPLGVEQGFTIPALPRQGHGAGSLTLALSLNAPGLRARLAADGRGLALDRAGGAPALTYADLQASDATGRALPASLALSGHLLLLRVRTAGARYPLAIDPLLSSAKLIAASPDTLGPVAMDGDTIVVGAPCCDTINSQGSSGAVFVFVEPATGWGNATQTATLTPSTPLQSGGSTSGLNMGTSVAISGDTIVAGALFAVPGNSGEAGAALVYLKGPSGWVNSNSPVVLAASDGAQFDDFGASVALSGDTLAVGMPQHGLGQPGAAYVFVRPPGGWGTDACSPISRAGLCVHTQTAKLTAAGGAAGDQLGDSIAVSDGTLAVGASQATANGAVRAGAVYVFSRPAGGWVTGSPFTARLGVAQPGIVLGSSLSLTGDTLLAGAPGTGFGGGPATGNGAVYAFTAPGGWQGPVSTSMLTASDGQTGDLLGTSVATAGNFAFASAPRASVAGNAAQGAAYAYQGSGGSWPTSTETAKLLAAGGAAGDALQALAASGPFVAGVAPAAASPTGHGAAYVFDLSPPGASGQSPGAASGGPAAGGQVAGFSQSAWPAPPAHADSPLSAILLPHGKAARIRELLRHGGFTFAWNAPGAGRLSITWTQPGTARGHRRAIVVAKVTRDLGAPGPVRITVRLTPAGRRLLRSARRVRLDVRATFTPRRGARTTAAASFGLTR